MQKPFPFNKAVILIIDDDKNICELVSTALKLRDYEIHYAFTPQEGLGLAKTKNPSLIILDVHLNASIDGIGLLSHLKRNDSFKNTPILMLTSADSINYVEQAFKEGAAGYLPKPLNLNRLIQKVETLLKENLHS